MSNSSKSKQKVRRQASESERVAQNIGVHRLLIGCCFVEPNSKTVGNKSDFILSRV
jgi:hypothetical protein